MSPMLTLTIDKEITNISINHAVKKAHVSQAMRRKLRNQGTFKKNGQACSWDTLLQGEDFLEIFLVPNQNIEPYDFPLDIIYEDDYLLVVNKPAGLLMHPTSTERFHTLANAVIHYLIAKGQKHTAAFHPIHRLDKDTSGLVVIAKNSLVQHAFTKKKIKFSKTYDAFIQGQLTIPHLSIHWPIGRKEGSIIERTCSIAGKNAHTDVRLIKTYRDYSHVECLLHTGRTHQIRVHLSHLGYPLLGDDLYGGSLRKIERQALHAKALSFTHPITGDSLYLVAPLAHDLRELL